jgi:hypothetical protein
MSSDRTDADLNSVANAGRTKVQHALSVPVNDSPAEALSGVQGPVANARRTRLG